MSSSTETPKHVRGLAQIHRFTDYLIPQRDQRVGCEHDCAWTHLRDGHSFSDGIPQRELTQRQGGVELFCDARRSDFKFESTFGEQCSAPG